MKNLSIFLILFYGLAGQAESRPLNPSELDVLMNAKGTPEQMQILESDATTIPFKRCQVLSTTQKDLVEIICPIEFDTKLGVFKLTGQQSEGQLIEAQVLSIVFKSKTNKE